MANSDGFISYLVDSMHALGPVQAKRMFGGHGMFLDGLMFALVIDDQIYLKADKLTANHFIQLGLERFTYMKKDKRCYINYYQMPDECLDDNDALVSWCGKAYEVAMRAA